MVCKVRRPKMLLLDLDIMYCVFLFAFYIVLVLPSSILVALNLNILEPSHNTYTHISSYCHIHYIVLLYSISQYEYVGRYSSMSIHTV